MLKRFGTPTEQAEAVIAGTLELMQEAPPPELLPDLRAKYRDSYKEEVDRFDRRAAPRPELATVRRGGVHGRP